MAPPLTGWSKWLRLDFSSQSLSTSFSNKIVYVKITSAQTTFWATVKSDGTDVRFTATNGTTLLNFEVRSWNYAGQVAIYKVQVPTFNASSTTSILLQYGNAGAASGENRTAAYTSAYRMAWNGDVNQSIGAFADSTSNGNNGTNNGTTDIAGKVGQGCLFTQASSQFIEIADANSLSFGDGATDTPMLIAAWIKPTDATKFRIFSKINAGAVEKEYAFYTSSADTLVFNVYDNSTGGARGQVSNAALTADEGTWVLVGAFYDGSGTDAGITLFRGGATFASTAIGSGSYTAMENLSSVAWIGKLYVPDYASGAMQDITLRDATGLTAATATDWFKLEYASLAGTWLTVTESATIAIPKVNFNFTGKIPTISATIAIPKVNFNFTGKIPTITIVPPTIIAIPKVNFNFTRFAPTIRTQDKGIQVPKVNFNFTGKVPTVGLTGHRAIAVPKATFNFTGKVPSVLLTNTEEEISWGIFDTSGNPITGATVTIKIRFRDSGHILDWSDNTFKLGGGSSPTANMTELDAANFQGYYGKVITIGGWADGWYIAATTYTGTPKQNGSVEFLVKDGLMVDSYNSANLDVAVSSRPTLSEIEGSTVLAKEGTAQSILTIVTLLKKYVRNKKQILTESGVKSLVIYDDNGTTEIVRKILKDPSGNDISDLVAGVLALENASSV